MISINSFIVQVTQGKDQFVNIENPFSWFKTLLSKYSAIYSANIIDESNVFYFKHMNSAL